MNEDAIRYTETSEHRQESYAEDKMAASRVTGQIEPVYIEPELLPCLCNDPYISLVTVIDWIRVGVLWRQAVVDAEHRYAELDGPFSGVILMCTRVLTDESTSVEVNNC